MEYSFLNYALFVTFFPKVIQGPIALHYEIIPQFENKENQRLNSENMAKGIMAFAFGLAKKVLIADLFGNVVNIGFGNVNGLNTLIALITMFSYTMQIYFDFSGYCDMATGIALMFNIKLPMNFNSPYKATTITEFWKRWHITLTRFFTQVDNDLAFNWNSSNNFSKEEALNSYTRPKISKNEVNFNYYMQNYEANMKNITKYIEEYTKTKFVIFFPSYSILSWDNMVRTNRLEASMDITKRVMEDLLEYDNVELYYFTNVEEIITNLDNYKDYTHYNEDINYYMYESMCKTGEHRITKENYIEEINKMRNIAISYNYDKIFEE